MTIKGGDWEMSDAEFEQQYAEATRRGELEAAQGTYAVAARYDKTRRQIVVELANGLSLVIPARLIQGLQEATVKELSEIEILGAGSGLYWPQLSVDIGLAGLLTGRFGTKSWMAALGCASKRNTTYIAAAPGKQRFGRQEPLSPSNGRKSQKAA